MRTPRLFLLAGVALLSGCGQRETVDASPMTEPLLQVESTKAIDWLPALKANPIIVHDYYTLSYSEKYEQAEWVAYELKAKDLSRSNNFERPFFIEDPKVKTRSADWRNYKKSGYDKGHLCPAGDRKFSKKAFDETFYTSNISPQRHEFNDGIWNRLEQKTRYWAQQKGLLFIVTGGVLNEKLATIGKEKVAVPDHFYKIIFEQSKGKRRMIGFLVPHQKSDRPLYEFVVPVDAIEKMTGIDFFPQLEDQIENELEQNASYKDWSF